MKVFAEQIRLSASDLSNHLACQHLTTLELQVARGKRTAPEWADPDLAVILERGDRHEKDYLADLGAKGLTVENLGHIDLKEEERLLAETLALMERGAQVIAQGGLRDGEWFGRPDVLRRVEKQSKRWAWSYEVVDTKLARETKATTILQLSLYSDLLKQIQGTLPEFLWVVPPGEGYAGEKYSVLEYAAYYRHVRKRLLKAVGDHAGKETYPEPVEHCNVCRWFRECDPFVGEQGLQYLFGFAFRNPSGEWSYDKKWALNGEEEKKGFEWLVDKIMQRRETNPKMHVYHFGAYEPGALKRLMGM